MSNKIKEMRAIFLKLDRNLKKFGKEYCKFYNRKKGPKVVECFHPSMGYGGMTRNTDCELENCPRVLYGNEGT